jgi:hypothetical protein
VLEAATVAFLEAGNALIVATVAPDGEPHASRGWGFTVLGGDCPEGSVCRGRLLLEAADGRAIDNAATVGSIAVTAANPLTFKSIQLKGRVESLEMPTAADDERAQRYADEFFAAIMETDSTPRPLLERMLPVAFVPATVVIDDVYDQTPGPGAGAPTQGIGP